MKIGGEMKKSILLMLLFFCTGYCVDAGPVKQNMKLKKTLFEKEIKDMTITLSEYISFTKDGKFNLTYYKSMNFFKGNKFRKETFLGSDLFSSHILDGEYFHTIIYLPKPATRKDEITKFSTEFYNMQFAGYYKPWQFDLNEDEYSLEKEELQDGKRVLTITGKYKDKDKILVTKKVDAISLLTVESAFPGIRYEYSKPKKITKNFELFYNAEGKFGDTAIKITVDRVEINSGLPDRYFDDTKPIFVKTNTGQQAGLKKNNTVNTVIPGMIPEGNLQIKVFLNALSNNKKIKFTVDEGAEDIINSPATILALKIIEPMELNSILGLILEPRGLEYELSNGNEYLIKKKIPEEKQ